MDQADIQVYKEQEKQLEARRDQLEARQKQLNEAIERIRHRLNLSDSDTITAKEWGVALLFTGASVWIVLRVLKKIFGIKSKQKEVIVQTEVARYEPARVLEETFPLTGLTQEQLNLVVLGFLKKRVDQASERYKTKK